MDILNLLTMLMNSPATGDRFPVVPIAIIGGIAAVIAVISAILAAIKKKKDDDE